MTKTTKLIIEIEIIQSDTHSAVQKIMEGVYRAFSFCTFKVLSWKVEIE